MADTYEKDLAQKSTLTTSDYIRVVGSDNVSYKQLASSVLDLNGTFYDGAWKANADLDTLKTTGIYWISSNPTNGPTGLTWFPLIVLGRSWGSMAVDTARQIAVDSSNTIYTRVFQSNAWGAWVKQSTRAEVDALNGLINNTQISDLDGLLNAHAFNISVRSYGSGASNKPSGNSGVVITQGSGNYRGQFVVDLGGAMFTRTYINGTISAWVTK